MQFIVSAVCQLTRNESPAYLRAAWLVLIFIRRLRFMLI